MLAFSFFGGFSLRFLCNHTGERAKSLLILIHGDQIAVILRFSRENIIVKLLFPIDLGDAGLYVLDGFQ